MGTDRTPPVVGTLAERLRRDRRQGVVGRQVERERFAGLLAAGEPAIIWLHAPGGTGKSTLVRAWAEAADAEGCPTAVVDLQMTEAAPARITAALAASLGVEHDELATALLDGRRYVLFFDTWELGGACAGWLREAFLPSLPDTAVIVFSSREAPDSTWRADPGWHELFHEVALQNFSADDAGTLLSQRGVPEARHQELIAVTRGHPLALALVSEVAGRAPDEPLQLEDSPQLLTPLIDRFVRKVPSNAHRAALRLCAHARFTTEALLRDVLAADDVSGLFDWLRGLSFVVESPRGVRPHALARDVIDAEFRWRDPVGYADLHRRLGRVLFERLRSARGDDSERIFLDSLYPGRIDPLLRKYFLFEELGGGWADQPTPEDRAPLLALTEGLAGAETAKVVDYWLGRYPEAFTVARSPLGEPQSFGLHLILTGFDDEDLRADPVMPLLAAHTEARGGLRSGEKILLTRLLLVPPVGGAVALRGNTPHRLWLTTPHLALSFHFHHHPEYWEPIYRQAGFVREPELEARIGSGAGVFSHDWRATPAKAWVEREIERQLGATTVHAAKAAHPMPRDELARAVRDALRNYARSDALAAGQLGAARCVGGGGATAIRQLLDQAVAELGVHPRDQKLQRALTATYIQPAPTQEAAAERLNLPFSTYRRHLRKGIERVVDWMWRRETHTAETRSDDRPAE